MDRQAAYDAIASLKLMAGLRGAFPPATALPVTDALMQLGIHVFEFTMNSTEALAAMQAAKRAYGGNAVVGMGTVLDRDTALQVLDAGADFVVAPSLDVNMVAAVHEAGVLAVPGVITPTEAVEAWRTGASLIKIFPIGNLGVDYFKNVRGPLDHIPFCCNGGMNDANVGAFLEAGAVACGMAAWLTGDGTMPINEIARRGRLLMDAVERVRSGRPHLQRA